MGKVELRQIVKQKLSKLSAADIKDKSLAISRNIKHILSELNSKNKIDGLKVGVYMPILKEPLWFLDFTEKDLFHFSLVHMHDERKLSFYEVSLQEILDKSHSLKLVISERSKEVVPDVLIIPGVGFTDTFERIGRGKGYFDSYLKNFRGVRIGTFFEDQKCESVFSEDHDECLDFIVTEKNIYRRG